MTADTNPHEPECKRNIRAFLKLWNAAPIQRTHPRDTISHQRAGSDQGARLTASDLTRLLDRDDYAEQTRLELADACARYRCERDELHIRADALQAQVAALQHEHAVAEVDGDRDEAKPQPADATSGLSPIIDQTMPSPTASAAMDIIFGDRTIRRGAQLVREQADAFTPGGHRAKFYSAIADWLESWAEIDVSEHGPYTDDWKHALKVARTYLGERGA